MICPNCDAETDEVLGGLCKQCPANFIGVRIVKLKSGGEAHVIAAKNPAEVGLAAYRLCELMMELPAFPSELKLAADGLCRAIVPQGVNTPMFMHVRQDPNEWKGRKH